MWKPEQISVIIGANASGKSNFADFHEFLADVYRHGISVAIARKGGYENIAHRKKRRSRSVLSVHVEAETTKHDEWYLRSIEEIKVEKVKLSHFFSFLAEGNSIRAGFKIVEESIRIQCNFSEQEGTILSIKRDEKSTEISDPFEFLESDSKTARFFRGFGYMEGMEKFLRGVKLPRTELVVSYMGLFVLPLRYMMEQLASIRIFQLSPTDTRKFGVPIPNPQMERYGENLPAVVDMIRNDHKKLWSRIITIMQELMPSLERIEVDYTHSRTLALFFHEKGIGRPWTVTEVSDGTIHSLALLTALFDPRSSLVIIEEPENSIHTWILRTLMDAVKDASKSKQILLTTHSRTVIDGINPRSIWVMWKSKGESNLVKLEQIDRELLELVESGELTTFELLDTGALSKALPQSYGE